jgi:hypothetical protein
MQIVYRTVRAILVWLNEPQSVSGGESTVPDWADLPPYHPAENAPRRA